MVLQHRQVAFTSYTHRRTDMQLHPALVTTLIAEHERALRRRADQRRARPPRQRLTRRAPWTP